MSKTAVIWRDAGGDELGFTIHEARIGSRIYWVTEHHMTGINAWEARGHRSNRMICSGFVSVDRAKAAAEADAMTAQ